MLRLISRSIKKKFFFHLAQIFPLVAEIEIFGGWQDQKVLFEQVVVASAHRTFASCGRNWNLKNLERPKKGNYCHKRRYRQNVLTWFRPNHPTFRPQEAWFDHCHPTGVRRAVGNFGHKRKKVALAVIDFGQGKKCRFSWIFFLQEQSWPKISKIWFRRGKSQKFETHVGQWKIGFIEHSLRYTRRWIVRKRAALYQDSIEIHMIMSGEYRV